jgi:hypothetical protein
MIQTIVIKEMLGKKPPLPEATGMASMPPPIHVPATSRAPVMVLGERENFEDKKDE